MSNETTRFTSAHNKAERLLQIERLLLHSERGKTQSELAKIFGVSKATIHRDIQSLSTGGYIYEDDSRRLRMDPSQYLHNVRLSMYELEALHLSARLFSRVMKFPFPHASSALRKLADAQRRVSDSLADQILFTAEDIDNFSSPIDFSRYRRVIENIGRAMSESSPVKIRHFSVRRQATQEFVLFPITLEPHHEGRAVHLLSWDISGDVEQFRTIKIERIEDVELLQPDPGIQKRIPLETIRTRFRQAWGIWSSEAAPQRVQLMFSKAVAHRVAETQWHPSMTISTEADGSLKFYAYIAEPREMYPWIRGWGPDVQVLEPEWLRQQHMEDCRAMADMYEKIEKVERSFGR